jgi:hypothetical protein
VGVGVLLTMTFVLPPPAAIKMVMTVIVMKAAVVYHPSSKAAVVLIPSSNPSETPSLHPSPQTSQSNLSLDEVVVIIFLSMARSPYQPKLKKKLSIHLSP